MNFFDTAIPILLIAIAIGFVYVYFLKPWVFPLLVDLWNLITGKKKQEEEQEQDLKNKEIVYD